MSNFQYKEISEDTSDIWNVKNIFSLKNGHFKKCVFCGQFWIKGLYFQGLVVSETSTNNLD